MAELPLDVGDVIVIFANFADADGVPGDPSSVVLTVRKPDGTLSTPDVSNPSVGRHEGTIEIDQHGTWFYRWEGTGGLEAAEEGSLEVRRSRVLN